MEQKNVEDIIMEYKLATKGSTYCVGDHALQVTVAE